MKTFFRLGFVWAIGALVAFNAFADPQPLLRGEFKLQPQFVMHPAQLTGQITVLFEGDVMKQVKVKTDVPVMDKSEFQSSEQWFEKMENEGKQEMALVYRLAGPPHRWYFVVLGLSAEGITYDCQYYKVRAKLPDIQGLLKTPFNVVDGKPVVPIDWKAIGTGTLKR